MPEEQTEVPNLEAIVRALGGEPLGQTEVPLLQQIVSLLADGTSGTGTVSSVGLALPSDVFTVSGSPVTGAGTLTGSFKPQASQTVLAGPISGNPDAVPTFRFLQPTDIPAAGSTEQVQFNQGGLLSASSNFRYQEVGSEASAILGDNMVTAGVLDARSSTTNPGKVKLSTANGNVALFLQPDALNADRTATFPNASGNVVLDTASQTLTNKTISGASNTISNIATTALTGTLQAAQFPALTGDVTTSAGSLATTIANNAVTTAKIANANVSYAKLPSEAESTLLGRGQGSGAGDTQVLSLGTGLSMSGTTLNVSGFATLGANTFTRLQTITQGTANEGVLASTGYSLTGANAQSL